VIIEALNVAPLSEWRQDLRLGVATSVASAISGVRPRSKSSPDSGSTARRVVCRSSRPCRSRSTACRLKAWTPSEDIITSADCVLIARPSGIRLSTHRERAALVVDTRQATWDPRSGGSVVAL